MTPLSEHDGHARRRHGFIAWLACATLLLAGAIARAQGNDAAWLDGAVGAKVGHGGPPGAAAVVVRSDGSATLRAWGSPTLGGGTAVDPERTVFRIGSITKTFTAIAVLQLVEEGKVRLDDDVNRHLKGVQVPSGPTATRVLDLLGHRGGFDGDISLVGLDDAQAAALSSDERLQRDIRRVRPAGRVSVYDNMAYGLLGQLVETVDGVPYAQAIERRILRPLGMTHSRIGLPADNVAGAYEVGPDGQPHATPQIHLRRGWQGAGDMSATAGDMSRFLGMLLAEGRHEGGQLLRHETFRRFVDTTSFALTPGLPGVGLGVYELGQRGGGYGHGGTIRGFNGVYMVLPRQGIALFAVMNLNRPQPELSMTGLLAYLAAPPGRGTIDPTEYLLFELPYLAEQRWQPPAPAALAATPADAQASQWEGRYAYMRLEDSEALLPRLAAALLVPPSEVNADASGQLTIDGEGPYRAIAPGLFASAKGGGPLTRVAGFANVDGIAVMGPHTLLSNRRLADYEVPALTVGGLLLAPLLLLVLALVRRPIVGPTSPGIDRLAAAAAALFLAILLAELAWATLLQRPLGMGWVVTLWRVALHGCLAALLWAAARAWWTPARSRRSMAYASLLALLCLWLVPAALYWHVLGKL